MIRLPQRAWMRPVAAALAGFTLWACREAGPRLEIEALETPAGGGSHLPQVAPTAAGALILSWLEPQGDTGSAFRLALLRNGVWSPPATIAAGPGLLTYSADLPGVSEVRPGLLAAYHGESQPGSMIPYANLIRLQLSQDDGAHWSDPVVPHTDGVSGQHEFVATFTVSGGLGLVWLDARRQRYIPPPPGGSKRDAQWLGSMGLWSAVVDSAGRLNADRMVDSLTCECCPTAAAATSRGPVVVYRDRDQAGNDVRYDQAVIRDISLVRLEGDHWTRPHPVHRDNWVFNGCPDNGPAVDAAGDTVVVAWWTAAQQQPRVQVAFSDDAGNSFGDPFRIDRRRGEGQVSVVIVPGGAIVGWLEEGRTWARWVARDGRLGALSELGLSPRRARLPRWIAQGDTVFAGWTEEAGGKAERVRLDRLRLVRR